MAQSAQATMIDTPAAIMQNFPNWFTAKIHVAQLWITAHWAEMLIGTLIGALIYLALKFIRTRARLYAAKQRNQVDLKTIALRVIGRTSRLFRLMASIMLVAGFTEMPASIHRAISFLFTIVAVWQVAIWARELILGLIERRAGLNDDANETLDNAMALIRLLVSAVIFIIAAIVILDNLGVNVTGLVAGLGIGGIAIGLAAQGIFSDLFAALSIIFDKPFRRGEIIQFDTMTATVEKIGLKSTRLRSLDGQEVIVSNTNLLAKQIDNMTRVEHRRTRLILGLIYQTKPAKLRALPEKLAAIIQRHNARLVRAGFAAFNASSIDFELIFEIDDPEYIDFFNRRQAIAFDLIELFTADGYEFAYPTQTTFTAAPDGEMILPYAQVKGSS